MFVFFSLAIGAGVYWFSSGEYQGQAAETINASKETVMTNTLVGYWTLDGNDIVWGDTTSEIKDVNPGTKHHGNSTNLAAGSAVRGRVGQGLLFNGTSGTISLGNVYNGVKTVSFWVKPNTTTQSLIDLNATATVDINAGTVRGNNFTTPTIYVDGAALTGVALAAPTFVAEYPTAFNSTTSPKTAMNAVAINSGDVLVLVSADEGLFTLGETENGSASWVNIRNSDAYDYTAVRSSGYTATATETLTATITSAGGYSGGNIVRFSGSDGIGASATNSGTTGSPSVSITTTQDNSAIVVIVGDWNAISGTQIFTSDGGAGSPTNLTDYPGDGARYGVAIAYYPDAGTAGAKTVGMSAPSGQKWTIHAIEVKGNGGDVPLDTEWHHIAVTTATGINASAAYIGQIASSYFGGTIDDIRFYSDALTATQVADLYRASSAKEISNANHREALTNGLVGYWTFDGRDVDWGDTGTEVKDISGNANHGAVSGLTRTSAIRGKLGQGMRFNNVDSKVDIGNIASVTQTICAWANAASYPGGDPDFTDAILYKGNDANIGFFGIDSGNAVAQSTLSGKVFAAYPKDLTINEWHHVCGVLDGPNNSLRAYMDGVSGIPVTITSFSTNSENWSIGYHNASSDIYFFDGILDDVRMYNRALPTSEILNLYNLGR